MGKEGKEDEAGGILFREMVFMTFFNPAKRDDIDADEVDPKAGQCPPLESTIASVFLYLSFTQVPLALPPQLPQLEVGVSGYVAIKFVLK